MCYRLPDVSCSSEDADPWTVILQTFEGSLELPVSTIQSVVIQIFFILYCTSVVLYLT